MTWRPHIANATTWLFTGIAFAALVYLFYASALRERVENKLYDVRTRLAPDLQATDGVAVAGIDEDTIRALDPGRDNLSYASLLRIVQAAQATRASIIAVLIPPQVFPYKSSDLGLLAKLAAADPRLLIGIFGDDYRKNEVSRLPAALRAVSDHVYKADIERNFRRDIIRNDTIFDASSWPYLDGRILQLQNPAAYRQLRSAAAQNGIIQIKLNYLRPQKINVIPAQTLLTKPAAAALAGKILLIGYTTFRPWTYSEPESTFVNTPWEAEGSDVQDGVPVVTLHAIGILNLLSGAWLVPAPPYVGVIQAVLLSLLVLVTWRASIGFASLLFIGGWSLLLIGHAFCFSLLGVYVPLADSFLWSSLATLTGAFLRIRTEGRLRAIQVARFLADKDLAETQDRFLNSFAHELSGLNSKVAALLQAMAPALPPAGATRTALTRAIDSQAELRDFLTGIQQFAALRRGEATRPVLVPVDLRPVVSAVLRQFDTRRQEAHFAFKVESDATCQARSDATLVGQILYNLVSNAVKYSPPGSTVTVRMRQSADRIAISVKDQGPGIAPEYHDRIFEKFYRLKDDLVYKHKGHGLGLYLSRFFAEQIGAHIAVDSDLGKGAEFTLTLPRERGVRP